LVALCLTSLCPALNCVAFILELTASAGIGLFHSLDSGPCSGAVLKHRCVFFILAILRLCLSYLCPDLDCVTFTLGLTASQLRTFGLSPIYWCGLEAMTCVLIVAIL
ncbi:hypothetical protein BaRGS_00038955, partial [Batillaria attramentaria]